MTQRGKAADHSRNEIVALNWSEGPQPGEDRGMPVKPSKEAPGGSHRRGLAAFKQGCSQVVPAGSKENKLAPVEVQGSLQASFAPVSAACCPSKAGRSRTEPRRWPPEDRQAGIEARGFSQSRVVRLSETSHV